MTNMVISTSLSSGVSVPSIAENMSATYRSGQSINQLIVLKPGQQYTTSVGFSVLSITPSAPVQLMAQRGGNATFINQTVNQQTTIDDTVDGFSVVNNSTTNTVSVRLVYTVNSGTAPAESTFVTSVNGKAGAVTLSATDITGFAAVALSGSYNDLTNKPAAYAPPVATTSTLGGVIVGAGLNVGPDGTLSVTALGGVSSFNTRTGDIVLTLEDVTSAGGAPLDSAMLTGTPQAPTPSTGDVSGRLATTEFVADAVAHGATGAIATFEFVATEGQTLFPATFPLGAVVETYLNGALLMSNNYSTNNGVGPVTFNVAAHESDEVKVIATAPFNVADTVPIEGGTYTGPVLGLTAAPGDNSKQFATTEYVQGAITSMPAGVTTFNTRSGAVTLTLGDVITVGGAPLASPTFTGIPAVPTAAPGTSTSQAASTAFVTSNFVPTSAIGANSGVASLDSTGKVPVAQIPTTGLVTSVNGNSGAVTITAASLNALAKANNLSDVANAATALANLGGAPLASPQFTSRVQAPAYSYTTVALGNVSGTATLDLGAATEWSMTITAATTLAFTNTLGANLTEVVYIRFTNAGSAAITWPASTKFAGGAAPTFTAAGTDIVGVKYDTVTSTYMVFVVGLAIA